LAIIQLAAADRGGASQEVGQATPPPTLARPATLAVPVLLSPMAELFPRLLLLTVVVLEPIAAPPKAELAAPPRAAPARTTGPLPVLPWPPSAWL
jgi:hypothetical protein